MEEASEGLWLGVKAKNIKEPARWDCHCLNLIRIQRAVCVLVYASVGFKQCKLDRIKPRVVLELLISQTICFPFHLRHFKHAAEALIRSALTTQQLSRKESLVHFIFINKKKSRTVQYHKAIFLFVLDHHDAFYQRESLFVFLLIIFVRSRLQQLYITKLNSANIHNTTLCCHSVQATLYRMVV